MSRASVEAPSSGLPQQQPAGSQELPPPDQFGASRVFGAAMVILGAIGLYFSGLIMFDKIVLMQDPTFTPACTLNSIVSCTDVMASPQASAFGFPNPFIGLVGFPIIITMGLTLLSRGQFPRWMWWGLTIGLGVGVVFVHWLAYSAIFTIGALCLYCMAVWAVMLALFIMALVHTVRESARAQGKDVASGIAQPAVVLAAWYVGFAVVIWQHFFF